MVTIDKAEAIGVIKMACSDMGLPVYLQTAGEVKRRWANEILVKKGIIVPRGRGYILAATGEPINKHELDALRHGMHFSYFYNK